VAQVVIAKAVGKDFDRIIEHLEAHESTAAAGRIAAIVASIDVLATSPLIGRPVEHGHRELVIGRGAAGHVALYHYDLATDLVVVLAVRAQKEDGYRRRPRRAPRRS
jgi:toxin ParE1/3/4